jgi:SAM-dependent methyltransferase
VRDVRRELSSTRNQEDNMEQATERLHAAELWAQSAGAWIAGQDAGERVRTMLLHPVMLRLTGNVAGARVLDLGCGEGRFSRMLGERGARTVGIDPIAPMIEAAQSRDPRGAYVRTGAEALPFRDASFDLVVSYITLVDIVLFREAIAECVRVLAPGSRLLVANLGFTSCALPGREWARDESGKKLHKQLDHYASEFEQILAWSGIRISNWHRPLSSYMQAYLAHGLALREFLEPVPEDQSLRDDPWWEDFFRVPDFNVMLWEKPA